ncbi:MULTISPECIES: hypothetical protein [Nostocales]
MASKRFQVSWLGEYYMDCLEVEAALKDKTRAVEAANLLCLMLDQEEEKRRRKVQYLADKRGVTFNEMWHQLRTGTYKITNEDIEDLKKTQEDED